MEGSTGNYSGSSSTRSFYPPSLYDTSVSSASAGKSRRRNTTPEHSSYSEREELHLMPPNQYPNNDYQNQETGHHMYSKSSRSIDNSKSSYNRDITAMSDPGGARSERNQIQHRSRIEYAGSEIMSPSYSYYESQQRRSKSSRHLQEENHKETKPQYSRSRYSSAPTRIKSLSPPSEQQHREAHSLMQKIYSRDAGTTIRDNSFVHANEDYHDGMYTSSPSYNERSLGSSSSTSAVNVKELKRQLWNNNEVLKGRPPSPPKYYRRIQQSLSPTRQPRRQGSTPPSNNLPRFARSLSPRRRRYQHSSSTVDESPSLIQKASSTISETSYNNRFHSKFYEAALVAQNRFGANNKAVAENEKEKPQKYIQQYQQQEDHRQQSFSSQSLNEGDSNRHHEQNFRGNKYEPTSSKLHYTSNRNDDTEYHRKAIEDNRRNDSFVNMNISKVGNNIRKPPIIPPLPSSSSSPSVANDERQERHQHRHLISIDRGRSKDLSQFRGSDGRSVRKMRPPSPLLLDRIRSFDHDYYHDSTHGVPEGREQGYERVNDRHDENLPNDNWRGMNYHDNANGNNGHKVVGENSTNNHYIVINENIQSPHQGRFHNEGNNFDNRRSRSSENISTVINRQNMQGGSQSKHQENELEGSHDIADVIGKDRMTNLFDKLSAVNRENPKNALAQIDSILRQESRSSNPETFENLNCVDDTKDSKIQKNNNSPTESNLTERKHENDGEDVDSYNEDDDESSDVSSITNPIFQQGTSGSHYSKHIDPLYIPENDRYNMHDTTQNSNLGEKIDDFKKSPFNPSTSSFRRPRPSHLQNYSKDGSKDLNAMSRSEWKRQQLKRFPPPSTIKVKDDLAKSESLRQNSADFRERMLQKNMKIEASRGKKKDGASGEQKDLMIVHGKPKNKIDKSIADNQYIDEKVPGWHELSNQSSKFRSEQEENTEGYQSVESFTKRYPWDRNLNNVQMKDTSMDDAIGIEAEMSTRGHHCDSHVPRHDAEAELSMDGSAASSKIQGNHFEKARRNIKHRSDRSPFNDQSIGSNDNMRTHPGNPTSDHGDSNLIPNIERSMTGIPQFNPSDQRQLKYDVKHHNEKKSDGKSSSGVAMPPSSFFPDMNNNFEPISTDNSREPNLLSKPSGKWGGHEGIYQQSTGVNNITMQDEGVSEFRSITRLSCKTIANKEPKLKEKKRGFLRAFMEKKKTKASSVGYTASASVGSISGHATSVESRGVKSASYLQSNSRPNSTESPKGNFHLFAPPPGVLDSTNTSSDKHVRSRAGYRRASATRHPSNSSENFRSSSMALKFNRVMQLYDSDEA